jgi:hypothetical protein
MNVLGLRSRLGLGFRIAFCIQSSASIEDQWAAAGTNQW